MAVEPPRSLADLELVAEIADDLSVGIWVASAPEGRLLYSNRAFAEILGMQARTDVGAREYSRPYGIHTRDGQLYPEDRLPFARALLEKKTVCVDDIVIHRHDGGRVFIRAFGRPTFDATGEVTRVTVAFLDISLEVRAQERASSIQQRLTQAERVASLGMLAASIGHEINSPLSYATSNLERLALGLQKAESALPADLFRELRDCVVEARDGVERAAGTVRSMRDVSRADVERCLVDVRAVVGRALRLAGTELRYRARVSSEIPDLPPVLANEGQLAQVFINLLHNAAHAIVEGRPLQNEIRVRAHREPAHVVVEVVDTGVGMTPAVRARIYEPFFTTKPPGEGTGLGLSICLGLLEGMGGTIECDSEPGRGTTFRVRLPIGGAASAPHAPDPEPVSSSEPTSGLVARSAKRARVLVIDDDARLARSVKALLDDEHEVEVETSAASALTRLMGGDRFEVILCDLMMREMTGMDLFDKLRAGKPEVARAFVFMTGGAFTARAQSFLAGVDNPCLDKPFVRRELVAAIADRLAASQSA